LNVCNALFPLLRSHARVVNVSSFVSLSALNRCSPDLQKQLRTCKTADEVGAFMKKFVAATKKGDHKDQGWPEKAYGVSKIGVTLLSVIQQHDIDKDKSRSDIIINGVCPGYVATDMSSHKGPKTINQGADTPLYAALLSAGATEPRGRFISDREVKEI